MSVHLAAVLTALLVIAATPTGGGAAFEEHTNGPYGITSARTVHTPTEMVALAGTTVAVSATSTHSGYEPITATITAPTGTTVQVELLDANGDRRAVADPASDGTVSIPTDALSSGTYYLAVRDEGEIRVAERAVVSRHDVSLAVNDASSTADALALYITVIPGGDIPYYDVEVVATDGVHESVTSATEIRLGLYEATVNRTTLPAGEYAVYARLVGRPDPYVGLSESVALTGTGAPDTVEQSGETDVTTERAESTVDDPGLTTTQFPETGIALLLAAILVGGLAYRLRR